MAVGEHKTHTPPAEDFFYYFRKEKEKKKTWNKFFFKETEMTLSGNPFWGFLIRFRQSIGFSVTNPEERAKKKAMYTQVKWRECEIIIHSWTSSISSFRPFKSAPFQTRFLSILCVYLND